MTESSRAAYTNADVRKAAGALAEAPLDASVEDDVRLVLDTVGAHAVDRGATPDILRGRLEDAEAKVARIRDDGTAIARVRELLDESDVIWFDAPEWATEGVREFTERIRAVLDGDA